LESFLMIVVALTRQVTVSGGRFASMTGAAFASILAVIGPGAFAGEAEYNAHMAAGEASLRGGDEPAAMANWEAALREAQALGWSDRRLVQPMMLLGHANRSRKRFAEAESMYKRVLDIEEQTRPVNQQRVFFALSNLGALYSEQFRFNEAEPLLKRALDLVERGRGTGHVDTAKPLDATGPAVLQRVGATRKQCRCSSAR
jgi:tetratricopeptide (TPR) repeat protein